MSAKTTKKVSSSSAKTAKPAAKGKTKPLSGRPAGGQKPPSGGKAKVRPSPKATIPAKSAKASSAKKAKPAGKPQMAKSTAKGHPVPAGKAQSAKSQAKKAPPPKPQAKKSGVKAGKGVLQRKPVPKQSPVKAREVDKKAQLKAREVDKKAQLKAREAEKKAREADKKAQLKAREAEKKAREKEAQRAALAKKQEAERKRLELERKKKETERLKLALEQQKARDAEKARREAEREAERETARRAAEAEKLRRLEERESARLAKEQERARLKAEREAEREEARRLKEEERAKRDAEREAYRKAKEAEREKLRAAKEAARRALEGRIAEANRNANKLGGGRSSTTRIYSPKAIPDQSGTTRRGIITPALMGVAPLIPHPAHPPVPSVAHEGAEHETRESTLPPANPESGAPAATGSEPPAGSLEAHVVSGSSPAPGDGAHAEDDGAGHGGAERIHPSAENIEERYRAIEERLKHVPESLRRDYQETIDMSWIHHDSALEGVVYTFQELKTAIEPGNPVVTDSSLQPVIDEIRRHKAAIELVRDLGERKRAPITVDTIKKIYVTLHPEEGDVKTVKYRRDIPQHRLYFHEYSHPEKITQKVRQIVEWLNGPEPKKLKSPIRTAARVHYELLRTFPFQNDSGKVARFVMNLILMRSGHPPAIIHSTERQRYYEALKGALPVLVQMVTESILNALSSIEKLLDDHDAKVHG